MNTNWATWPCRRWTPANSGPSCSPLQRLPSICCPRRPAAAPRRDCSAGSWADPSVTYTTASAATARSPSPPHGQHITSGPMRAGEIVFTGMERVVFGRPAAEVLAEATDRLGAKRVFILAGRTLNRETDAVRQIAEALGPRYVGVHDEMPAHSPRDAVVACASKARDAGCDLLVSVGGGSTTDGGKAVTICLEHDIREPDGLDPSRTLVAESTGKRHVLQYRAPRGRRICVPTTLSGGEFNARAAVTEPRLRLKQAYIHPGIIPLAVIFDPAITVHTPEWLWLSS